VPRTESHSGDHCRAESQHGRVTPTPGESSRRRRPRGSVRSRSGGVRREVSFRGGSRTGRVHGAGGGGGGGGARPGEGASHGGSESACRTHCTAAAPPESPLAGSRVHRRAGRRSVLAEDGLIARDSPCIVSHRAGATFLSASGCRASGSVEPPTAICTAVSVDDDAHW